MSLINDADLARSEQIDSSSISLALLRNSRDCVKLLNMEGRISFMSENGQCAMEIDDMSMIAGKPWWDLWPASEREGLSSAFAEAANGKDVEYRGHCPTAKGTPKDWEVRLTPVVEQDGTIKSVLAVSREIG